MANESDFPNIIILPTRPSNLEDIEQLVSSLGERGCTYVLKDFVPVLEPDILKWIEWFRARDNSLVATSDVPRAVVRTVFLGIPFGLKNGCPLFFMSTVLGGPCDRQRYFYTAYPEAQAGHRRLVGHLLMANR